MDKCYYQQVNKELFDVISREYQLIVKLIKKKYKNYVSENGENIYTEKIRYIIRVADMWPL